MSAAEVCKLISPLVGWQSWVGPHGGEAWLTFPAATSAGLGLTLPFCRPCKVAVQRPVLPGTGFLPYSSDVFMPLVSVPEAGAWLAPLHVLLEAMTAVLRFTAKGW